MLNSVLDEWKKITLDQNLFLQIESTKAKSLKKKKKFILKNAPFSLLKAGWGQEEDKRKKYEDETVSNHWFFGYQEIELLLITNDVSSP